MFNVYKYGTNDEIIQIIEGFKKTKKVKRNNDVMLTKFAVKAPGFAYFCWMGVVGLYVYMCACVYNFYVCLSVCCNTPTKAKPKQHNSLWVVETIGFGYTCPVNSALVWLFADENEYKNKYQSANMDKLVFKQAFEVTKMPKITKDNQSKYNKHKEGNEGNEGNEGDEGNEGNDKTGNKDKEESPTVEFCVI